jgi:hypothetical protein
MIQITDTFNILSSNAPYIYNWTFNKDCVTVDNATGTATTSLSSTFTCEEFCFPFIATLQLIDRNGCSTSIPYTYSSPCTAFTLSEISQTGPLSYIVTTTGGQNTVFEWIYDTDIFNGVQNGNTLTLSVKPNQIAGESHTVFCRATSINNCTKEVSRTFTYEIPEALNFAASLTFCKEPGWQTTYFDLQVISSEPLDYSSLTLSLPNGINFQWQGNKIRFTGNLNTSGQQWNIPYSIANVNGFRSNTAVIVVTVPNCIIEFEVETPIIKGG